MTAKEPGQRICCVSIGVPYAILKEKRGPLRDGITGLNDVEHGIVCRSGWSGMVHAVKYIPTSG